MCFAYCALGRERPAGPSARFSKFVIQRGTLGHELRKPKGTSNSMILVPAFRFEVPEADSRHTVQEFQIGGTRHGQRAAFPDPVSRPPRLNPRPRPALRADAA